MNSIRTWRRSAHVGIVLATMLLLGSGRSASSLDFYRMHSGVHARFSPGEELRYDISLWGLQAGYATMEVRSSEPVNGEPTVRLQTEARSNAFVSIFFPVHNEVISTIHSRTLLPLHLIFHRREGSRHEDFDVTFHRGISEATVVKNGNAMTFPIDAQALDPLSCLYFLRDVRELIPGGSVFLKIFHDRKTYDVEVKVEAIENVKGPWGQGETIRVLALMPFRGIFLNEGNIRIWLTNDDRRIPVRMQAKVIIGSIEARLDSPV